MLESGLLTSDDDSPRNSNSKMEQENLCHSGDECNIQSLPLLKLPEIKVEAEQEDVQTVEDEDKEHEPKLSILKTSLLTGAAATLATLSAAAEQIAQNSSFTVDGLNNEINKPIINTAKQEEETQSQKPVVYTSILQSALLAQRTSTIVEQSQQQQKLGTEHLLTLPQQQEHQQHQEQQMLSSPSPPHDVLKTAVTLASLREIATARQQQKQQQEQQQFSMQQQKQLEVKQDDYNNQRLILPLSKLNKNVVNKMNSSNFIQHTSDKPCMNQQQQQQQTQNLLILSNNSNNNNKNNTLNQSNIKHESIKSTPTTLRNSTTTMCISNPYKMKTINNQNSPIMHNDRYNHTYNQMKETNDNLNDHFNSNNSNCSSSNNNNTCHATATQTSKCFTTQLRPALVTTETQTDDSLTATLATTQKCTTATETCALLENADSLALPTSSSTPVIQIVSSTSCRQLMSQSDHNYNRHYNMPNAAQCKAIATPINANCLAASASSSAEVADAAAVTVVVFKTMLPDD